MMLGRAGLLGEGDAMTGLVPPAGGLAAGDEGDCTAGDCTAGLLLPMMPSCDMHMLLRGSAWQRCMHRCAVACIHLRPLIVST
jgi:hypothetical protein